MEPYYEQYEDKTKNQPPNKNLEQLDDEGQFEEKKAKDEPLEKPYHEVQHEESEVKNEPLNTNSMSLGMIESESKDLINEQEEKSSSISPLSDTEKQEQEQDEKYNFQEIYVQELIENNPDFAENFPIYDEGIKILCLIDGDVYDMEARNDPDNFPEEERTCCIKESTLEVWKENSEKLKSVWKEWYERETVITYKPVQVYFFIILTLFSATLIYFFFR